MFHLNYDALTLTKYTKLFVFGCEIDKMYCYTGFFATYNTGYQKRDEKRASLQHVQLLAYTSFDYVFALFYWTCALFVIIIS